MEQKCINIFPVQRNWRRVYWFHHICLSVRLWTESSPLCNFHNTIVGSLWFHIYTLYQEGVLCVNFLCKIPNLEFKHFFLICNSDSVVIWLGMWHYRDVIMGVMASQITSLTIVYSTVYSDEDQRKHQSSASLAFFVGNSPVTGEFPAQMASNADNVSIWWRHHDINQ